ncbi:uL15 family ribosomal protein [Candidatus Micrarchaeota archaeon]|nr:uL15 family ribosomal protein [Candidatus Micrarchaeota archaeon]
MTKRKEGQKKGYLGHRSHGRGNVKNRRGSGNRGGRGMAGIDKHKWSWAMVNDKHHFGKFGFARPNKAPEMKVAHLFEIDQQARLEKLEKKGGKFHFHFDGKILATGTIKSPVEITAAAWSKNVEKKLKECGGSITKIEGKAPREKAPKAPQPKTANVPKAG